MECFVAIPEKLPIALAVGRHWYHPNRIMQNFACFVELLREERQVHACILKHSFSSLMLIIFYYHGSSGLWQKEEH